MTKQDKGFRRSIGELLTSDFFFVHDIGDGPSLNARVEMTTDRIVSLVRELVPNTDEELEVEPTRTTYFREGWNACRSEILSKLEGKVA